MCGSPSDVAPQGSEKQQRINMARIQQPGPVRPMMMMNPNANFSMATTWVNGSTTTLAKTHSLPFRGGTPFPARRDTVGVSTDSSRLDRLPKATRKAPPAGFSYGDKILANPENTGVFLEERQRTDAVLRCLSCDRVLGKRMLDHNPVLISHADKDLEKGNLWKLFCSTSCWVSLHAALCCHRQRAIAYELDKIFIGLYQSSSCRNGIQSEGRPKSSYTTQWQTSSQCTRWDRAQSGSQNQPWQCCTTTNERHP